MKTKGDFREMPKYCPYAFFHKDHFDVIVKVRVHDSYKISAPVPTENDELVYTITITSKKGKYKGHELLYVKQIALPPVGVKPQTKIVITVAPPRPQGDVGVDTGGSTVVRYGDIPPSPTIS